MIIKLNENQLDILYNIFEANKQNDSFWKWFQGSKVVNADGSPKEVYHGTPNSFDTFDTNLIFLTDNKELASDYSSSKRLVTGKDAMKQDIKNIVDKEYGVYDINDICNDLVSTGLFKLERRYKSDYSNERVAMLINIETGDEMSIDYARPSNVQTWLEKIYQGGIMQLFCRIVKPFVINAKGRMWDNLDGQHHYAEYFVKEAKEQGCDGLIIYNVVDGEYKKSTQYIPFSPNQVKSAYYNNGEYSLISDNVYESI